MSEETKEETKQAFATIDDYEKAKTKFDRVDYSEEEFFELANLYSDSFNDVQEVPTPESGGPLCSVQSCP